MTWQFDACKCKSQWRGKRVYAYIYDIYLTNIYDIYIFIYICSISPANPWLSSCDRVEENVLRVSLWDDEMMRKWRYLCDENSALLYISLNIRAHHSRGCYSTTSFSFFLGSRAYLVNPNGCQLQRWTKDIAKQFSNSRFSLLFD